MKLFLIKTKTECYHDEAQGFLVRAKDETEARQIVVRRDEDGYGRYYGDEGPEHWLNPNKSTCVPLLQDGEPGVILRDFLHG